MRGFSPEDWATAANLCLAAMRRQTDSRGKGVFIARAVASQALLRSRLGRQSKDPQFDRKVTKLLQDLGYLKLIRRRNPGAEYWVKPRGKVTAFQVAKLRRDRQDYQAELRSAPRLQAAEAEVRRLKHENKRLRRILAKIDYQVQKA